MNIDLNTIPFIDSNETEEPEEPPVESHQDACISSPTSNGYEISYGLLAIKVLSIATYIFDVFSDYFLAFTYFQREEIWSFILTLIFVLIPSFCNTVMDLKLYAYEHKHFLWRYLKRDKVLLGACFLLVSPLVRLVRSLKYAWKCKKAEESDNIYDQEKYYEKMLTEDSDVAMLRLLESFLESASQLVLQLTILMMTHGKASPIQIVTIVSSFLSMSWSLASYQRSVRALTHSPLDWCVTSIIFVWYLFITVSRILSIVVAATVHLAGTLAALFVHWMAMFVWLIFTNKNTTLCGSFSMTTFFNMVLAIMYIFIYVGMTNIRRFYSNTIFYATISIENILALLLWYFYVDCVWKGGIVYYAMTILIPSSCILGILFMLIYYKVYHPTIGCKDWSLVFDAKAFLNNTNKIVQSVVNKS